MADKIFNFLINYFSNINDRGVDKMNNFRGNISSNEVVEWLKKVQNIPVEQLSEDFEEAFDEVLPYPNRHISEDAYNIKQMEEMFCAGVQWQKEQLMKSAIDATKEIEPPSFEEAQGEFNSYNVVLNG